MSTTQTQISAPSAINNNISFIKKHFHLRRQDLELDKTKHGLLVSSSANVNRFQRLGTGGN